LHPVKKNEAGLSRWQCALDKQENSVHGHTNQALDSYHITRISTAAAAAMTTNTTMTTTITTTATTTGNFGSLFNWFILHITLN